MKRVTEPTPGPYEDVLWFYEEIGCDAADEVPITMAVGRRLQEPDALDANHKRANYRLASASSRNEDELLLWGG